MSVELLSEARHEYLKGWIASARDALALGGWYLELSPEATPIEGALASSFVGDEADRATIRLSRAWLDLEEFDQRRALIHELLHPTLHRITGLAEKLIEGEIGHAAERLFCESLRLAEEQAVDRLALGLAPFFPPIEFPADGAK